MIMKVLGIVGSPRKKGNTNTMVDTFLEGASSGADVKKCFLIDLTINQCMGCARNCVFQEGVKCKIHRDDMEELLLEVISSDIILFTSPLYCATYTSLMTRFFERALPLWHIEYEKKSGTEEEKAINRCPVKGKKAVIGMVQDSKVPKSARIAFEAFEHNICEIYKMDLVGKMHVTDVRSPGDIERKPEELKRIFELGKSIVSRGR
jgi:multimeric flavodoxin WrbA